MKSTFYKNRMKVNEDSTTLWDEFVDYLDSVYFSGASELLDNRLIAFEYESFVSCYSH